MGAGPAAAEPGGGYRPGRWPRRQPGRTGRPDGPAGEAPPAEGGGLLVFVGKKTPARAPAGPLPAGRRGFFMPQATVYYVHPILDGREYPWYSMEFALGGDLAGRIEERQAEYTEGTPWDRPDL